MLAGDFYIIDSFQNEDNHVSVVLELDAAHEIFAGHFPQQPVVPGVCMMQIIKEITEQAVDYPLNLVRADEMKFLAIIDPLKNTTIRAELKYTEDNDGKVFVTASLLKDELIHFKFKGSFTQLSPL